MPIAASTICLFMLSVDRYATVQHPQPGQLRHRRLLPIILIVFAWTCAIAVCLPLLFIFEIDTLNIVSPVSKNLSYTRKSSNNLMSLYKDNFNGSYVTQNIICKAKHKSEEEHLLFVILYLIIVYIMPSIGVIINYFGVRQKLCALSLTARAAHGELPLPMPIIRKPSHMIIVTSLASSNKNARAKNLNGGGSLKQNFIDNREYQQR